MFYIPVWLDILHLKMNFNCGHPPKTQVTIILRVEYRSNRFKEKLLHRSRPVCETCENFECRSTSELWQT